MTICTPTYRRAGYLAELIDSVLAQRYERWHMVIRDNSEDDETAVMVRRFDDPRIDYRRNERNLGMGANVRRTLDGVRGGLFTHTPDDDVWEPENLSRKVGFLVANPDVDAVFSHANRMDAFGYALPPFRTVNFHGDRRISASVLKPAKRTDSPYFVNIVTGLLRTNPLLSIMREGWHLDTEEYFMWYLGCRDGDIGLIGEALLTLREAEHYRTVLVGGNVVDTKGRSELRQRQLLDFYRCLRAFRPEVSDQLDQPDVQQFVAEAIVSAGATLAARFRAVAMATGWFDDVDSRSLLATAVVPSLVSMKRKLSRRVERDVSGIGPV